METTKGIKLIRPVIVVQHIVYEFVSFSCAHLHCFLVYQGAVPRLCSEVIGDCILLLLCYH